MNPAIMPPAIVYTVTAQQGEAALEAALNAPFASDRYEIMAAKYFNELDLRALNELTPPEKAAFRAAFKRQYGQEALEYAAQKTGLSEAICRERLVEKGEQPRVFEERMAAFLEHVGSLYSVEVQQNFTTVYEAIHAQFEAMARGGRPDNEALVETLKLQDSPDDALRQQVREVYKCAASGTYYGYGGFSPVSSGRVPEGAGRDLITDLHVLGVKCNERQEAYNLAKEVYDILLTDGKELELEAKRQAIEKTLSDHPEFVRTAMFVLKERMRRDFPRRMGEVFGPDFTAKNKLFAP